MSDDNYSINIAALRQHITVSTSLNMRETMWLRQIFEKIDEPMSRSKAIKLAIKVANEQPIEVLKEAYEKMK